MIFLILISTLIIEIAGVSSLAIFSGETSSSGKITGTVVKKKISITASDFSSMVGTGGLVADNHPTTDQLQATTAYRYTGANPDNYIRFNNEVWRIIGIFDVDDGNGNLEKRIKIIRGESIGEISWNFSGGYFSVNNWINATGMTLLNTEDYWNRTGSYTSTGLTAEAKLMIDDAKWYLGGAKDYTTASNGLASHFYGYERGTTVYSGRPTSWVGKVGLMYLSDYGYATNGGTTTNREACLANELYNWTDSSVSDCKNNDWLYDSSNAQWTLTPYSGDSSGAFALNGEYVRYRRVDGDYAFRPTLYLRSDIQISGSGTSESPFEISG